MKLLEAAQELLTSRIKTLEQGVSKGGLALKVNFTLMFTK
jgi:hypothetical protein